MSVIWRKVWSDLWGNKARTQLLVVSVAVGVFAVGMIFGMSDQMISIMDATWQQDMPQHVTMYLAAPISPSDGVDLRHLPGVDDIAPPCRNQNVPATEIRGSPDERRALGKQFGAVVNLLLKYQYNYPAAPVWLALLLIIGLMASILTAKSVTRISVRQSLSYE